MPCIVLTKQSTYVMMYMRDNSFICGKGVIALLNTNATSFRKDMFKLLEQTIKFNEPVNISTKDGNAVVISEEDYNSLMETLYLSSMPEVKKAIIEGLSTSVSDCISESEIQW